MSRQAMIERYRTAPDELAAALEGLAGDEADRAVDGAWTVRGIVNHVADAELVTSVRIRRLLAEDRPAVPAWNEEEYADRLHNHRRSVRGAMALIRAIREVNADLLEKVPDEDWDREAVHSQTGPYTLAEWFERAAAADHVREHAAQVRRARGR